MYISAHKESILVYTIKNTDITLISDWVLKRQNVKYKAT